MPKGEKTKDAVCCPECCDVKSRGGQGGGAVYGLGFIGALVYFIGQSTTFWLGVLGVLKAVVWPAYAVYFGLQVLLG